MQLFLGIDVGTGGVRAMAVAENGAVAAEASVAFDAELLAPRQDRHEQSPEAWWQAVRRAIAKTLDLLNASDLAPDRLAAISVDGTSGTLVVLDSAGRPMRPAIMYNDSRSADEAEWINLAAEDFCLKLGYRFTSSFALAKITWLRNHETELFEKAARFVHQADYVLGRLTGGPAVSDYSNALKTGYDLIDECWPAWIDELLQVTDRLPDVVAPGTKVGSVSAAAAAETGLPKGLAVVTGASDGTAACLASGLRRPGDYNTTLGTTLVYKGISRRICRHPDGLIYSHKLPGGLWLPGAAGNVGAEWIPAWFPAADVRAMDAAAEPKLPCDCIAYPLVHTGERFPFISAEAEGFFTRRPQDTAERYAACLQGTALVERLGYHVLDAATGCGGGEVFSTGGGSRSDVWMQCRADATGRVVHRPGCGQSAFGSALLAAAGTFFAGAAEAAQRMVRIKRSFTPHPRRTERYNRLFEWFCAELQRRGYL